MTWDRVWAALEEVIGVDTPGLEELGFDEEEVQKLAQSKYRTVKALRNATRVGLLEAGLAPAAMDSLLKGTGALGSGAEAAGTEPITITIYDPHETPDTFTVTFSNAQTFDKYMARANIASLFRDGQSPGITEFSDLVPGATYTTSVRSIPARVRNLERHKEHLVRRREKVFACAIIDDLATEGIQAEELAEERVAKGEQGDVAEVDVAVRFLDGTGFVLGSMKTYINGDSDIRSLEKKIQQHYAQRAPFAGHHIQPAFMAETVKADQHDKLKDACKKRNVRLFARNGRSISRVHLRAAATVPMRLV